MTTSKVTITFDLSREYAGHLYELGRSFPGLSKNQVARKLLIDTLTAGDLAEAKLAIGDLVETAKTVVGAIPSSVESAAKSASEAALKQLAAAQETEQERLLRDVRLDLANLQSRVDAMAASQAEVVKLIGKILPKL